MIFRRRRALGGFHALGAGAIAGNKVINSRTEVRHYHLDGTTDSTFSGLRVPVDGATSDILHELRQTIKAQLLDEVAVQELWDPPLRVTWNRYQGSVFSLPEAPAIPGRGKLDDLAALFSDLPRKRLIILGPAGAGKTTSATLLMLKIVQDSLPETQVPVIFPLSSWDLDRKSLRDWISETLCDLYAVIGSKESSLSLIQRRHVIPVLDGLDELPRSAVPRAVTAINQAFAGTDPYILICRTADLDAISTTTRSLISADAALELAPVELDAAVEFIAANTTEEYKESWARVAAEVRETTSHPMTRILERPLTIWLARAAFRGEQVTPVDFLNHNRFHSAADIETFLVEAMVPALLKRAGRVTLGRKRPFRSYPSAKKARHVLAFMAVALTNQGSRRFEWWGLPGHIGSRERKSMVSWLAAAPSIVLTMLMIPVILGQGHPAISLLLLLLMEGVLIAGTVMRARRRASFGSSIADAFSDFTWIPIRGIEYTPKPKPQFIDREMRASIRGERRRAILGTRLPQSFYLMVSGVTISFKDMHGFLMTLPFLIVFGGSYILTSIPPTTTYPGGRKTSWGPYVMTRLWLSSRGVIPFRLVLFLEKAQHAGLLRPVGAAYEFRNVELQKALARAPGIKLQHRVHLVPPLTLPGAALYLGKTKSLILENLSEEGFERRSLRDSLTDIAAVCSSAMRAGDGFMDEITTLIQHFNREAQTTSAGPHGSILAAFLRDDHLHHLPCQTAADLQQAELNHLRFALDTADAEYTALIGRLSTGRRKDDISVARLVFRTALVAVDRCQDGTVHDWKRAMEALREADSRLTVSAGADHPETLTALLVELVVDEWFISRARSEPWRRDEAG
ncbi:NACHT domain-containing protein [Streptomyces collinus]|uniref:NACHT domain-containing protein n=1 Tax=Streptomyces collinus TaxID=42684 RepID=UPI0033FEB9E3